VPLRRSPRLTPESLAARWANALKSTGPRTARGKARVSLNALKHGRYAARSARLRERLIQAGYRQQEILCGQIRSRIAQAFGAQNPASRRWADQCATKVWCLATRPKAQKGPQKTKLESPAESKAGTVRVRSHSRIGRFRFGARDDWRRPWFVVHCRFTGRKRRKE
jgi:hypothetical protein